MNKLRELELFIIETELQLACIKARITDGHPELLAQAARVSLHLNILREMASAMGGR